MSPEFVRLQRVWETLGSEDPLWAVATSPDKRGGRWDVGEFLATGEAEVARMLGLIRRQPGSPARFRRVLDFGCGVGRLTLAWRRHAERVRGIDISAPMIEQARRLAGDDPGIDYQLNTRSDLGAFESGTFDLCFSHICLQHMPWGLSKGYLREFGRLCHPDGWIVFQLPSRRLVSNRAAALRQRMVDALPFGLAAAYRRLRHGSSAVFEMHFTPRDTVIAELAAAGVSVLATEPDGSAGTDTEGFVYVCRKTTAS